MNDTIEIKTVSVNGRQYDIVGVYVEDIDSTEIDFYDVFDVETGDCINEGSPFYEEPSDDDIRELLS